MDVWPSDCLSQLTIHCSTQSNKCVSWHHLAQDHNIPQNLWGLLECGVQESLDRDEKVEGPDNVLLEGVIRYASSVRTALWHKIEEDQSKVCRLRFVHNVVN